MEYLGYIFRAVLVVISAFSVIFCIIRGKGKSRKKMILFIFLFMAMVMICFGGEAVLSHFDMGWRCTPFNTMLFLCNALFIIILWYCMCELNFLKNSSNQYIVHVCIYFLICMMLATLAWFTFYLSLSSWQDGLSTYNGQTIVYANDQHGGSCSWRYYAHINSLVHGAEITQDGWWGYPPF